MKTPTWKKLALLLALGVTAPAWAVAPPLAGLTVSTVAPVPAMRTMDRAAVAAHWRSYYLPGQARELRADRALGWTGSIANCVAGDISPEFRTTTLARLNWYRALVGTPSDAVFIAELNAKNQAAALVLAANTDVPTGHVFDPNWKCYTAAGAEAGIKSNMGWQSAQNLVQSVDQYMIDAGEINYYVGHRRSLLMNSQYGYGAAMIDNGGWPWVADTIYKDDTGGTNYYLVPEAFRERRYLAYPAPGFNPDHLFLGWNTDGSLYWHMDLRSADFTQATVTMSDGTRTWNPVVAYRAPADYSGAIVWQGPALRTAGFSSAEDGSVLPLGPANDRKWTVTISGIQHEGVTRSITYPVYAFNPRDTSVNPVRGAGQTVVEYWHAGLDHYFITADANEQAFVDSGGAGTWVRTGATFKSGGTNPVCRFYGNRSKVRNGPNSHFYTADYAECDWVKQDEGWWLESFEAFWVTPATGGTCPGGTVPIYRAYNGGFARGVDSNHRITPDRAAYEATVARGWKGEGVVMCGGRLMSAPVVVSIELRSEDEAWALAQFAKRVGWSEMRGGAVDEAETYQIRLAPPPPMSRQRPPPAPPPACASSDMPTAAG